MNNQSGVCSVGLDAVRILFIGDDPDATRFIQDAKACLEGAGANANTVELFCAERLSAGLERLARTKIDVVLVAASVSESDELDREIEQIRELAPQVPIILIGAIDDETLGLTVRPKGIQDCLPRGYVDSYLLARSISYAVERQRLQAELERRERELRASESRLRTIIASNADGIIVVDSDGVVRFMNPAAEALFDRKAEELIGELFGFPLVVGATSELDIIQRGGKTAIAELRVVETLWEGGNVYLASLRDVTERHALRAAMEQASPLKRDLTYYDAATGLPNRRFFCERLQHAMKQAEEHAKLIAVLFLHLGGLERGTDSSRRATSRDLLLQYASRRLRGCVRESDTVARFGDQEFAVMLCDVKSSRSTAKAVHKITSILSEPFVIDGHALMISSSIGISLFPRDGADVETLLKNAGAAMHFAREKGKKKYRFYNH